MKEYWLEGAQVHSRASARPGFQWLPVGNDAERLAAHVPQRPITPDVVFRVPGMTLNRHSSELVVGPNAYRTTAERALAARSLVWRSWKSEATRSAMAGTVKRCCWLFVTHGSQSQVVVSPSAGFKPTTEEGQRGKKWQH